MEKVLSGTRMRISQQPEDYLYAGLSEMRLDNVEDGFKKLAGTDSVSRSGEHEVSENSVVGFADIIVTDIGVHPATFRRSLPPRLSDPRHEYRWYQDADRGDQGAGTRIPMPSRSLSNA